MQKTNDNWSRYMVQKMRERDGKLGERWRDIATVSDNWLRVAYSITSVEASLFKKE